MWKCRSFVEDVVEATAGRTLLQSTWHAQIESFLSKKDSKFTPKDILRASYRSRAMVAHLRDARRTHKLPPGRFSKLSAIIDTMVIHAEGKDADEIAKTPSPRPQDILGCDSDDSDDNKEPEEGEVIEVPLKHIKHELVEIDSNSDDEYNFSLFRDEGEGIGKFVEGKAEGTKEGIGKSLEGIGEGKAEGESSLKGTKAEGKSSVKNIGKAVGDSSPKVIGEFDLAKLVADAARVAAVDPRLGNKNFGWVEGGFEKPVMMKRPAGCTTPKKKAKVKDGSEDETPTKDDKPKQKSSERKLAYSKAYHKKLQEVGGSVDQATAKQLAQQAAKQACEGM